MGAAWELASFITRALGAHNQQSQTLVIVSQLLLLLAPLCASDSLPTSFTLSAVALKISRIVLLSVHLFSTNTPVGVNAFAYMTVGRMIHFFHPSQRVGRVKGSSVAKYFVWADIVSFLVQGTGGSMLSPGNSAQTMKTGLDTYMAGVGLQEGFIIVFIGLIVKFQRDMLEVERKGEVRLGRERWRGLVWTLYAVLLLISVSFIRRCPLLSLSLYSSIQSQFLTCFATDPNNISLD
jgi:RTA1 like protein